MLTSTIQALQFPEGSPQREYWLEKLTPLFKEFEVASRVTYLLTLRHTHRISHEVVHSIFQAFTSLNDEWINILARKRFQQLCGKWRVRSLDKIKVRVRIVLSLSQ
jgi:hypothetical protein